MGTPSSPEVDAAERRWRARPVASLVLRVVLLLVPAFASVAAGWAVLRAWGPAADGRERLLLVVVVVATSIAVLLLIERLVRRAMPVVILLRLSMVFPDRAPSRYEVARRGASPRKLRKRLEEARAHGRDDDPTRAAATILSLLSGLAAHDGHTRGHSERVGVFADMIAEEAGVDADGRERLRWAAILHDIGKLEVPAGVLNKPSSLSARDWDVVRRHPEEGARIAEPLMPWLGSWGRTIPEHHERWDGEGYPKGLSGRDISLGARIVTVADAYETMTASRPYRGAMSHVEARKELARCAGSQFDPAVVRSFLAVSVGKLRWASGPLALLGEIPVVREALTAASHVSKVASGPTATGTAATVGAATLAAGLFAATGVGDDRAAAAPRHEAETIVRSQTAEGPAPQSIEPAPPVRAAASFSVSDDPAPAPRTLQAALDPDTRSATRPSDAMARQSDGGRSSEGGGSGPSGARAGDGVQAVDAEPVRDDRGRGQPSSNATDERATAPRARDDVDATTDRDRGSTGRDADDDEDSDVDDGDCKERQRPGLDRAREVANENARSGLDNAAARGNATGCPPGRDRGDD